jgi:pimeloyl-ACP methyl ester carboxylesterase
VEHTTIAVGNAARPFDGCAQVRTADHVTRYARIGSGRPVLILDEVPFATTCWPGLVERLALERRVILPEVPTNEPRFAAWLRGFIDGMGLPPVTLVATGDLCFLSIEFALLEPERIENLVLVPAGAADETGLSGVLTSTLSSAGVRMLVIRRDVASEDAMSIVEQFLDGKRS